MSTLRELVKIADKLDQAGLVKEADALDTIIKKLAASKLIQTDEEASVEQQYYGGTPTTVMSDELSKDQEAALKAISKIRNGVNYFKTSDYKPEEISDMDAKRQFLGKAFPVLQGFYMALYRTVGVLNAASPEARIKEVDFEKIPGKENIIERCNGMLSDIEAKIKKISDYRAYRAREELDELVGQCRGLTRLKF